MIRLISVFLFGVGLTAVAVYAYSIGLPGLDRLSPTISEDEQEDLKRSSLSRAEAKSEQDEIYVPPFKRYALIIGNSDYTNGWTDLPGVAEDLQALPPALVKAGFNVITERDLDSTQLESKLRFFLDEFGSSEQNQLLIYFASHGATDPVRGHGYIVPTDAPLPEENLREFRNKSLSMNILKAMAQDVVSRHVLFIFDSCFAGTIFDVPRSIPPSIRDGLNKDVRFFITAGGADEKVLDRSVFRDHFIRGILGAADSSSKDQMITDVELGQFLVSEVYDNAGAPHKPKWGWINDPSLKDGVWAIPVPGSYRSHDTGLLSEGASAYLQGKFFAARDIWIRGASAGDVRIMKHLGDLYSGSPLIEIGLSENFAKLPNEEVTINPSLAFSWYAQVVATYVARDRHDIYNSDDRILKQSLRAISLLRSQMSSSEQKKALKRTQEWFEQRGEEDLYAIGLAYIYGEPFEGDMVRGMTFLNLAAAHGVKQAASEYKLREYLLTSKELEFVAEYARNWQPPLRPQIAGDTSVLSELKSLDIEIASINLSKLEDEISIDVIQRILNALGFRSGTVDYVMGPTTRQAIRRFQYSITLESMGEADRSALMTGVLTPDQLILLVRKGAEADHPLSQYILGTMFARGLGVEPDGTKAIRWLSEASGEGFALAHYALGIVYRDGTRGYNEIPPDMNKAAHHFTKAAELGYRPANDALLELNFEYDRDIE